jgi:hypothetical protein
VFQWRSSSCPQAWLDVVHILRNKSFSCPALFMYGEMFVDAPLTLKVHAHICNSTTTVASTQSPGIRYTLAPLTGKEALQHTFMSGTP